MRHLPPRADASDHTLDRVVLRTIREQGGEAGVKKCRELRERYYGSGSCEFGPRSLQKGAEPPADNAAGLDAALVIGRLNVEINPAFADGYVVVAQFLEMKQDNMVALAAVNEALKLEPGHRHAQQLGCAVENVSGPIDASERAWTPTTQPSSHPTAPTPTACTISS